MYFRVYAPNGEPFDVPRDLADKLILQDGWTQSPASTAWLDSIRGVEAVVVAEVAPEEPVVEQVKPAKGK